MMKKRMMFLATMLLLLSLELAAQSQRKMPDPEENARVLTERLAYRLNLSEDQKKEILAINLENAKKRALERESYLAEMDARRNEMKAQEDKIKQVLTEEQRKQWEEIKMDRQPGRRPGAMIEDKRNFHPRQHHRPRGGK
jgi:periplasmic protein CpxP/Spy